MLLSNRRLTPQRHSQPCWLSPGCILQLALVALLLFWLTLNLSYLTGTPAQHASRDARVERSVMPGNVERNEDRLLEKKKEVQYINANSTRMHGDIGLKADRTAGWIPTPFDAKGRSISTLLRSGGGFNLVLSESLPLNRDVMDSRSPECRALHFDLSSLPPLSVIIVFFNEPFSTLFRSVHSVLNRTPPQLLEEVILVDDGSTLDWIREGGSGQMEEYVKMLPKTKLVRSPTRKGIVSARMIGIRASSAPIFAILDSHIEVNEGWAEPLSQRIHEDKRRVLMPQIDAVNPETFEPGSGGIGCKLGFLWKLIEHGFDDDERSPADRRHTGPTDFVSSPTMAGGLFAAHRDFFLSDLGGYDEMFQFWGTENLELSFRTWMCGGRLECAPCSRVYHIFRKGGSGYDSPYDAVSKNKMRLLSVWMDEYADLAWRVTGQPRVDFGETKTLMDWKKQKQCKSFNWFLHEVNPESDVQDMPKDVPFLGPVKNVQTQKCLDNLGNAYPGKPIGIRNCHNSGSQDFMYFARVKHIMPVANDETCVGAGSDPKPDKTDWCYRNQAHWDYDPAVKTLKFETDNKCLAATDDEKLHLVECDGNDDAQKWEWPAYNPPKVFTPPPPPGLRGG